MMIKIKLYDKVLKVLSCIFAIIIVSLMILGGNVIDLCYLGLISGFVIKFIILSFK